MDIDGYRQYHEAKLRLLKHLHSSPHDPDDTLFLQLTQRELSIVATALGSLNGLLFQEEDMSEWRDAIEELTTKMAQAVETQKEI